MGRVAREVRPFIHKTSFFPAMTALVAACCLVFSTQTAGAQTDVAYREQSMIPKALDQVVSALLSYGQWCDAGCKYKSPGVISDRKVKDGRSADHFYTWTWISGVKDTKYFSEVTVVRAPRAVTITSRALGKSDEGTIKELTRVTGLKHDALFDSSVNVIKVHDAAPAAGETQGTRVDYDTRLKVSGFLAMFPEKLRKGLKEATQAVFEALRKDESAAKKG